MAVDDLWFGRKRGEDGKRLPTRRHGRGKRWRVRYLDDGGRKVERLFERRADADRFDAAVRADVDRGLYVDPVASRATAAEYGARWRAAQLHRGSTAELVERAFVRHVDPVLGRLPIASVRSTHVQGWVKGLDLAPSTARVVYSYVTSMFASATRDRVIAISPCIGVTLPAREAREHLTPDP